MNKKYGVLILIMLVLFVNGCLKQKDKVSEKDVYINNDDFYKILDKITITENYEFQQRYQLSSLIGGNSYAITGKFENGKLSSSFKMSSEYDPKKSPQPVFENQSCMTIQECSAFNNEILSPIKIIDVFKEDEEIKQTKIIKFSTNDRTCYKSSESTLLICLNENNELVNYQSKPEKAAQDVILWNIKDYDFSQELEYAQTKALYHDQLNVFIDDCTGECKKSNYFEFINNLNNPGEECFAGKTFIINSGFIGNGNQSFSYCNGKYDRFSFHQITTTGEPFIRILNETNEKEVFPGIQVNPEFWEKTRAAGLGNFNSTCSENDFQKIELKDKRVCYIVDESKTCLVQRYAKGVYCFKDKYLTNFYSSLPQQYDT